MPNVQEISTTDTNIEITPLGIRFAGEITREQWEALGHKLGTASRSIGFMIGDWINSDTEGLDADERYAEAIRLTGLDYKTLQMFSRVSRSVPLNKRIKSLTFEHHRWAAPLPPPERDHWLRQADAKGMSARRLQRSIAAGRVLEVGELSGKSAHKIETVHPFVNRTVSLFSRMKRSGWLKRQTAAQLRNLRADLDPVCALRDELDELISRKESIS